MNGQSSSIQLTVEQLTALCEEMRALTQSGVPLERGLMTTANELPGRLREAATEISERSAAGQSLEQIVQSDRLAMPNVLRAMILAGTRSGKLTIALEGMVTTARRITELRRSILEATIYPLLVLLLVSGLCFATLLALTESYGSTVRQQAVDGAPFGLAAMEHLGKWLWISGPLVIVAFLLWVVVTRQARALQPQRLMRWMIWVPWTRDLLKHACLSTFLDVLALLLEQGVPLHEALALAAQASGDEKLEREAVDLATALERGERKFDDASFSVIPSLVCWQLLSHTSQSELSRSLQASARSERRRADQLAEWLRLQLPVIFTIVIGGGATLIYALAVMAPWYSLLLRLADPPGTTF
ncbi:MAG: hypothetical protein GY768_22940 [Planctomycetaceae bacterium]|nr:hypothetical protein [Planctomycetaceae bacterium]